MGVLLTCGDGFRLLCKKALVRHVAKNRMVSSCGEGLMLNARSGGKKRKVEVGTGDCASVARTFRACAVQNSEGIHCFADVGAVAGADCMAVANDFVSVMNEGSEDTGVKAGLEEGRHGKLDELHF